MNRLLLVVCAALTITVAILLYQFSRNGHYVPIGNGGILDTRTGAIHDPARPVNGDTQVSPPIE